MDLRRFPAISSLDAEKASKTTIATLVRTGEGIISQEQHAWMSTSVKKREQADDAKGARADEGGEAKEMDDGAGVLRAPSNHRSKVTPSD